jgi:histone H3/H4
MVKAMAEETGVPSIGKDGLEALSAKVEELVKEAAQKAKADKRKTIKSRDLE